MKRLIIIGAGPSGVSAALYTTRANIDTTVIFNGYGALEKAHTIENYYGLTQNLSGKELFNTGIKQIEELGAKVIKEEVLSISWDKEFIVTTTMGKYYSDALLLSTGAQRSTPNIDNLSAFEGKGVSYCAVCDGFFFRGKDVCVIGNSNYALHEAKELIPLARHIYLLTDGKDIAIDEEIDEKIEVITKPINKIEGDDVAEKIEFNDNSSIDVSGIFIATGNAGSSQLALKIGVLTEKNKILVNEDMSTNIPGVFASGDCVGGLLQISKAVADGALAATNIIKYLREK